MSLNADSSKPAVRRRAFIRAARSHSPDTSRTGQQSRPASRDTVVALASAYTKTRRSGPPMPQLLAAANWGKWLGAFRKARRKPQSDPVGEAGASPDRNQRRTGAAGFHIHRGSR